MAQLSSNVVHNYLNERSVVAASSPDGFRYLPDWGDHAMFAGEAAAVEAATAAHTSRRAIAELLAKGDTDIASRQIFESLPSHVRCARPTPAARMAGRGAEGPVLRPAVRPDGTRARKPASASFPESRPPFEDYTDLRERLSVKTLV